MLIHLSSDLHLEFTDGATPPLTGQAQVIVLAGDIASGQHLLPYIQHLSRKHPQARILFVAGNHEFYHRDYDACLAEFRETFATMANVDFLENDTVEIDGVRFLGCTLWSGFDCLKDVDSDVAMSQAQGCIFDYHIVQRGETLLTPADTLALHQHSAAWLKRELARDDCAIKVVITHFPPSLRLRHGRIPVNPLSAYFQASCDDLIRNYQPALWLYGHNHWNADCYIGDTRLVSNQGGYPNEVDDYDPWLLIEI